MTQPRGGKVKNSECRKIGRINRDRRSAVTGGFELKLKVVVLVKQAPDLEAIVRVEKDGSLEVENRYVCSFFDEVAIEAALSLKKAHPEAEIHAFSAGGRRAADALRRAVSMGVDAAERVGDERLDDAESLFTAKALAARLRSIEPDIVLCGRQAGDDDMAAVGPMTAELLGMPCICNAVVLEVDEAGGARVTRSAEGESLVLEAGLPLLVTAEKGLAEPHIPLVTRVMKAMRAQIPNTPVEELGLADIEPRGRVRRLGYFPPPSRQPVEMLEEPFPGNVETLVRRLRTRGVLK